MALLNNPPYTLHKMENWVLHQAWNPRMLWWSHLLGTEMSHLEYLHNGAIDDFHTFTTWYNLNHLTEFLQTMYDLGYLKVMKNRVFYIISENRRVTFRGITRDGMLLIETYLKPK